MFDQFTQLPSRYYRNRRRYASNSAFSAPPPPATRDALRARIAGMNTAPRATPQPLRGKLSLRLHRRAASRPRRAPRAHRGNKLSASRQRRRYAANSAIGSAAGPPVAHAALRARTAGINSALRATAAATRTTKPSAPPTLATRAALRARTAGINSALRATPPPLRGQLSLRLRRRPPPAPRSARAPRE
eukprot:scaffold88560_cov61-Phaeocystis_antarctica.AAC.1